MPHSFSLLRKLYVSIGAVIATTIATSLSPLAHADDLQEIFNLAASNDPEIRQARATFNASHTLLSQGRSFLLPTISGTANSSRDTSGVAGGHDPTGRNQTHSFQNGFNSKSYGLNMQQALLNFQAWYTYKAAQKSDQANSLTLAQNEQQLIMKVATAYFDVLSSQANLASLVAEEDAARQVLDQTQQRFDVGLVAITDVYNSQANADLVNVNRLIEENTLNQRLEALQAITGQPHMDLATLQDDFPIIPVDPTSVQDWVNLGQNNNLAVQIAELTFEARQEDAKAVRAAAWPTLQMNANYNWSQSANPFTFFPGVANERTSIGVSFSLPIFTGGLNRARTRQAYYTRDASEEALLKARRDNTLSTSNAYRSVETDVRAVQARSQAIVSAQSSLDATQVGAEVGTRNIVDVVQAQRLLFQAQRDHANARFKYVIDTLTLKQAAGVLTPQDVVDLNQWLQE